MQHRLTSLFHPKGIAVVGASDKSTVWILRW